MALLSLPASFCIAFFLAFGLNWLALIPWRRSVGQHWTERARLLYPARKAAGTNNILIPAGLGFLGFVLISGSHFWLIGVMGFWGALLAGFFFSREVFPSLSFRLWLRLVVVGIILLFLSWILLFISILFMPENFGLTTWLIAGGIFLVMLALHFGLNLRLLRWFGLLQPATEALKNLVAEVSEKMRVPVRATWILSTYIGNAAAFPQTRQLIFTDKLLATLTEEETKGICAHELGHLSEPRIVLLARSLALFSFYPLIFTKPLSSLGDSGGSAFWILFLISICLLLTGIIVARRMEKRADKMAVENQADAAVYARALSRLYEIGQMPAVMPRRSAKVHPNLYDRMMTTGVTPDFPKPLPPGRSWSSYLVWVLIGLFFAWSFAAHDRVHNGPSERTVIVYRLRQIEEAKMEWAFEHNITNATQLTRELTPQDLAPYLLPEFTQKEFGDPLYGEVYSIGHLNEPAQAQLTQALEEKRMFQRLTLPVGAIIKLGTNGEEQYFVPSQPSNSPNN
jgi:Zn-dependent protease with chaperone function